MATELSSTKVAGGTLRRVKHASAATATDMVFAIFTPAATVEPEGGWPVIYWLSGLTCDDTNFSTKAGAFAAAAAERVAIVIPDTSPRGDGVANDEGYDLGQGAGFWASRKRTRQSIFSRAASASGAS